MTTKKTTAPKKKTVKKTSSVPKTDLLAVRAQQATDLKYGPEVSALSQLGNDARTSYLTGAGQAHAAADSIVAATNESSGGLADFLARAGTRGQETLNRIGPVSGALSNEGQLAARNHGLDVQSVAASLAQAKVRAQQAASYQTQRLYSQYQTDAGKINAQASSLASEAGQYAQQVYQSLLDDKSKSDLAAKKIASDTRNKMLARATQRTIAGVDVNGNVIPGSPKARSLQTAADAVQQRKVAAAQARRDKAAAAQASAGKTAAAAKAKKNAKKWLAQGQQNTYVGNVKTIAGLVRDQVGKPVRGDITLPNGSVVKKGSVLTSGAARQLLTTSHNPLGKAFDPTQINAAFDLASLGGLSSANVAALHSAGVKVNGRLPTVSGGAKKPKPAKPAGPKLNW